MKRLNGLFLWTISFGVFSLKRCFRAFYAILFPFLFALAEQTYAASSGLTYTGKILDSNDAPVTASSVIFTVTVYDAAGKCWLYTEQRNLDLSQAAGTFSFEVGSDDATTLYGAAPAFNNSASGGPQNLADLFSNKKAYTGLGTGNGCTGTYDPTASADPNEGRLLSVYFKIGASGVNQAIPPLRITPVPIAMQSLSINGYGTGELLRVDQSTVTSAGIANNALSVAQYTEFWALMNQASTSYLPVTGDVAVTGANNKVTTLLGQALPAGPATNGQVLVSNGTAWVLQSMSGGTVASVSGTAPIVVGGTATAPVISLPAATTSVNGYLTSSDWNAFNSKQSSSLSSGKILVGNASGLAVEVAMSGDATMDNAGAVTLKNTGTAGTYGSASLVPIVTTDVQGRVTGVTTAAPLDASKLPLAGGTMSGAIAMGGHDIANTGNISMAASKTLGLSSNVADPGSPAAGQVWYNSSSNVIKFYDGTSVQSLGVAGAGITSLNGLTSGTQTFAIGTSGNSPGFISATSTHTLNIPMASTAAVTAGLISKADYDGFNSKLGAVTNSANLAATKVWIGNASGIAQEFALSGDATMTSGGVVTVDKTQTAVASKILQLDSSSVAVTKGADIGGASTGKVSLRYPSTATDTTLTFPNSAGSASQFLQTDGAGSLSWATALSASTGFVNGGNNFGANSSLGNNDNFSLNFKTNNASRMTILNSGYVGIGTTTPGYPLEVNGNAFIDGGLITAGTGYVQTPSLNVLYINAKDIASDIMFNNKAGSEKMRITDGGNIGIGTAAPGSALDVKGTLRLSGSTSGYVGFAPAATAGSITYTLPTTQGSAGQVLSTDGVATTPTLSWITPAATLPGLASTQVWVGNASGAAAAVSLSGDIASVTNAGAVTVDKTTTAQANKILSLDGTGVAASMGNQLNGLTSGSLTLQPAAVTTNYSLTFPGAQGGAGQTLSNNGAGVLSWITPLSSSTGFLNGGNSFGANSSLGNIDNFNLDIKTNNTSRMTILNSGNVGIGTTAPSSILSFGGNSARTIAMERHTTANTAGNDLTIQAGGATSGATDKAGGDLVLASGASTGSGGSDIDFYVAQGGQGAGTITRPATDLMGTISGANRSVALGFASSATGIYSTAMGYEMNVAGDNSFGINLDAFSRTVSQNNAMAIMGGNVGIGTMTPSALLDVGLAGTTLGTLRLEGNTSGYVQMQPAAAAGSWTMTLPANAGTNGYVLTTNGAGVTSWAANSGGTPALSSLSAAAATNTIANANFAQTWNWDTLTTETGLSLGSTSMTSGKLLKVSSSSTGMAGVLADYVLTGNNAANTGTVLKSTVSGASSAAIPLMVTNGGTGLSFRVNDDGTDTDSTPFVIDNVGNVGIGMTNPSPYSLAVNGDIYINPGGYLTTVGRVGGPNNGGILFNIGTGSNLILAETASNVYTFGGGNFGQVPYSVLSLNTNTGNVGIGTSTPGSLLDVGLAGTTLGTLRLEGNTSGYVQMQPTAAAGSWTMTLPANAGTNGYVLTTNGSGVTSWAANSGGTPALSSLTAAAATNTIANANFAQAWNWDTLTTETGLSLGSTSMTSGSLLSLTDSFNSATSTGSVLKLTTSGASSAAVPLSITNAGTGISIRVNDDGTATDTSPFVIDSAGNVGIGTTAPVDALSIGTAITASSTHALLNLGNTPLNNASANGTYIGVNQATNSADFIDFQVGGSEVFNVDKWGGLWSGGIHIAGGDYGGRVSVSDGGTSYTDIAAIDQDDENTRALAIINKAYYSTDATKALKFWQLNSGVGRIGNAGAADPAGISIGTTGNVGIGTTTPGEKLEVTGNARVSGQLSTGSQTIVGGTTAINWNSGNSVLTDYNCASNFAFANLRDGGTYTLVVTDAGTTQCGFSTTTTGTDAATVTYKFNPANTTRTASTYTVYTLMRVGTVVLVSWSSGFQ